MAKRTKDEILKVLEALENGKEYVSGLNAILKDSNDNASKLDELTKKVSELEANKTTADENYNKLADFIGLSADVTDLDAALEAIKVSKGKENSADRITLQSKINELTRALKASEDSRKEVDVLAKAEKAKRQAMIRDIHIRNALEANKAVNPMITSGLLRDKVKVNDDDSLSFVADDGSEVTVDEGVKSFLEKYPEYRVNSQIPGAGGSFGGQKMDNVDFESMSPEEYRKLRKEGKIR